MMSKHVSYARPYAKALGQLAAVEQNYTAWSQFLYSLTMIIQDTRVQDILSNPLHTAQQLADWVYACSQHFAPHGGRAFIFLLATQRRLNIVPFIFSLFENIRLQVQQKTAVEVMTAHALTDQQKNELLPKLKEKFKGTLEVEYRVDETLMGGFIARAGDHVIDSSLRGLLFQLQTSLISGVK